MKIGIVIEKSIENPIFQLFKVENKKVKILKKKEFKLR